MKGLLASLVYMAALLAAVPFLRPRRFSVAVLLWPLKLLAGALVPVLGIVSAAGAAFGLIRRDRCLAAAGILGTGLAARFVRDLPDPDAHLAISGCGLRQSHKAEQPAPPDATGRPSRQRDIVYGYSPTTGAALRADLWEPPWGSRRSGLAAVFVHGGGWRTGDKDMLTRPFFRRLAAQGHLILDITYTLWPEAGIPEMVGEVRQAVLWLKNHAATLALNPKRIVLMGGSAGGHLALLAAYTPGHPDLPSPRPEADCSVCGVVAFYPPVDLVSLRAQHLAAGRADPHGPLRRVADALLAFIFQIRPDDPPARTGVHRLIPEVLGGDVDEIPDRWRLLSPSTHVGPHCPPTLLLQGNDDLFLLAPSVRRLHQDLHRAGVPAVLIDLPHAEHAFDLMLPQISPLAQAATAGVEQFLAQLT